MHVVAQGADAGCLYRIFCWMNTAARRAAIDAALGPAVPVVQGDLGAAQNQQAAGSVLLPNGSAADLPRLFPGALRFGLAPRAVALGAGSGALLGIVNALSAAAPGVNLEDVVNPCDVALVRDRLRRTAGWNRRRSRAC